MAKSHPESDEATAERCKLIRVVMFPDASQAAFAEFLGIAPTRWNNYERYGKLPREAALLLVRKFPGLTTDWLFRGEASGLPVRLQRELEEGARKMITLSRSSKGV